MATKKQSPAMEFVVSALKKNPKVEYGEVKTAATQKGLTVFPIMYGRAKALLGLVPVAARGTKKKAAKTAKATKPASSPAAAARTAKKKTARRGDRADAGPLDSLQALVADMQEVARDRDRYQQALEQISKILKSAL